MTYPEHLIDGVLIDDPPMSEIDRKAIRILSEDESKTIWRERISPTGQHFKLLPDQAWPSQLSKTPHKYEWYDDWNAGRLQPMSDWLSSLRGETETVFVFWHQSTCVEVPHGVFTRNWMNFLFEDEGCLVVAPGDDRRCIFSNGFFWVSEGTSDSGR